MFTGHVPPLAYLDFSFAGDGPNIASMGTFDSKQFMGRGFAGLVLRVTMSLRAGADADVWLLVEPAGMLNEAQDQALVLEHRTAWTPANRGPDWHSRLPTSGGVAARVQTRLRVPFPKTEARLRCATSAAGEWEIDGQVVLLPALWCPDELDPSPC